MSHGWQMAASGGVVGLSLAFYGDALLLAKRWPAARWLAVAILCPAVTWMLRWIAGASL